MASTAAAFIALRIPMRVVENGAARLRGRRQLTRRRRYRLRTIDTFMAYRLSWKRREEKRREEKNRGLPGVRPPRSHTRLGEN
jgi:hypothetical protein